MSLVLSHQIYPTTSFLDSLQTSFSRFHHGSRLQILRYTSSIPSKKHNFFVPHNLNYVSENYPQRNSSSNGDFSTPTSWIDKWSGSQQPKFQRDSQVALDYRGGVSSDEDEESNTSFSTGSSTMKRIVEKLKRFGYVDEEVVERKEERLPERGSVEDIFYVEEGMLPNSRGGFSAESPLGFGSGREVRFPWEASPKPSTRMEEERISVRRRSRTSSAELTLPESELRRLRHLAIRSKPRTKIGGAGVNQAVVEGIHEKWKTAEVVRLKCEGPPALNMKRMHEILERKTGGLVIWRSGTSVCLYRGVSYELPSMKQVNKRFQNNDINSDATSSYRINRNPIGIKSDGDTSLVERIAPVEEAKEVISLPEIKYEDEIDKLLDGLGPRYTDWPGDDPLPVDADLLPRVVPGYKPPFRILPYGVRATLGGNEATALRRIARILPPHFAVGSSRQHQGLAIAMIKLWETSSIAKVALKRGVQLTTSERMAEDIKKLTGGMILSRNKDFIVFYRGKNFLSPDVTEVLLERERLASDLQDDEEQARLRASAFVIPSMDKTEESGTAGTLSETLEADARWGKRLDDECRDKMIQAADLARHASLVRKLEGKLGIAERKLTKAERALAKVEAFLKPVERSTDPKTITDEERFMFRKIGLRMKAFLLLGRRGVFDGTVENMHLHWKYRELVKIIVKVKTFDQVRGVALSLEAESGGILVSVDKISKGFAVIVYRGRDYQRPSTLRPKNLLTKRKALARSIELQRHEALNTHISALHKRMGLLRSELDQMEIVKERGDEELYAKLDSAYSTEDEDLQDEGDEAYLETYISESEEGGSDDDSIDSLHPKTNFPSDSEDDSSSETDTETSEPHVSTESYTRETGVYSEAQTENVDFHY
ncbi:hypothetical protein GIB67_027151 [Kingdonia uniflora]|uniref:CRM domain-containing protein n=1 Tax=Kingdonia uniflora TaxID=39325 RepID=A0A7J7P1Y9_9MAGN|nr:hypothetical protein GIB67_027151 [Kingdonia uniflora]